MNMAMEHTISYQEIEKIVRPIAEAYGVERVFLFGSHARGNAKSTSDFDFRVDCGNIRGYYKLAGFSLDLEEAFGSKVDVVTTESLHAGFLKLISRDEVLVYEQP